MQDNVALRIYTDGALAATGATWAHTSANGTSPFEIGQRPDIQDPCFGDADEVAAYDRVLSAGEIVDHHQVGLTGAGGTSDPVSLDGTVIRVDPVTGLAWPGNPLTGPDENSRRVIAYGLRNPFRFELRPGTNELWLGDVGWNNWEEINRIANTGDATVENSGGPATRGWAGCPATIRPISRSARTCTRMIGRHHGVSLLSDSVSSTAQ